MFDWLKPHVTVQLPASTEELELLREELNQLKLQTEALKKQDKRDDERLRLEDKGLGWQKWGVIAALVAIGASAIAIGYQVHQAGTADQAARYTSISEQYLLVDQKIAEDPRLVTCFRGEMGCPEDLSAQESEQALAIGTYVVDFFQYLYDQLYYLGEMPDDGLLEFRSTAGTSSEDWVTWSETIIDMFEHSEVVCEALMESPQAWSYDFVYAIYYADICPELQEPTK